MGLLFKCQLHEALEAHDIWRRNCPAHERFLK